MDVNYVAASVAAIAHVSTTDSTAGQWNRCREHFDAGIFRANVDLRHFAAGQFCPRRLHDAGRLFDANGQFERLQSGAVALDRGNVDDCSGSFNRPAAVVTAARSPRHLDHADDYLDWASAVFTAVWPNMGWFLIMPMFASVILGGIGNPYGAIAGAYVIGISQELSAIIIPAEYKLGVALLVMLVVLLFRPKGIFRGMV